MERVLTNDWFKKVKNFVKNPIFETINPNSKTVWNITLIPYIKSPTRTKIWILWTLLCWNYYENLILVQNWDFWTRIWLRVVFNWFWNLDFSSKKFIYRNFGWQIRFQPAIPLGQGWPKFLPGVPHVVRWISVGSHLTVILAAGCILFILWTRPCGPVKIWSRATSGPRAGLWTCFL